MIVLPYIYVGNIYGSFREKIYHSFDILFKNTKRTQKINLSLSFIKNGIKNKKIGFSFIYKSNLGCDNMLWLGKTYIISRTSNKANEKIIVVLDCYFTNINDEVYNSVFLQALSLCEKDLSLRKQDLEIINYTYLPFINLHHSYNIRTRTSKNVINEKFIKLHGEEDFMFRRYKETITEVKSIYSNTPFKVLVDSLVNLFNELVKVVNQENLSKHKTKKEFLSYLLKVYFVEYRRVVYSVKKDKNFFAKNFMELARLNLSKENIKIFTLSKSMNSFFVKMFFEPRTKYYDNRSYYYSYYFYDKLENISKIWLDVNQRTIIVRSESFIESNISTLVYLIPNVSNDLYILHDESGKYFVSINLSKRYANKLLNNSSLSDDLFIENVMKKLGNIILYKTVKINIFSYENNIHYEIKKVIIIESRNYDYRECYLLGNYDNDINIFYLHLSSHKNPFVLYPIMQIINECGESGKKSSLYSNKVPMKFEILANQNVRKHVVLKIGLCNQTSFLFLYFNSKEFIINKVSIKDNYSIRNYYKGDKDFVLTINLLYDKNDPNANRINTDFNEMINIIKSDTTKKLTYITFVLKVTNDDLNKIMESDKLVINGIATRHYGSNYSNDIGLVFHEAVLSSK